MTRNQITLYNKSNFHQIWRPLGDKFSGWLSEITNLINYIYKHHWNWANAVGKNDAITQRRTNRMKWADHWLATPQELRLPWWTPVEYNCSHHNESTYTALAHPCLLPPNGNAFSEHNAVLYQYISKCRFSTTRWVFCQLLNSLP